MPMTAEKGHVGTRIKELREAAGLTQQQLANKAGMALSNLAQIEQGKTTDPRLSTLRALAKVLKVGIDELVG